MFFPVPGASAIGSRQSGANKHAKPTLHPGDEDSSTVCTNKHKNVNFQLNVLSFPSKLALQRMERLESRRKA